METFIKKELHYSLLFICLGNICRSPAADAVMHHLTETKGLSSNFTIDSAGIGSWHVGEFPDSRMRKHGEKRGYNINHIARQFDRSKDFDIFDYIVVMDDNNYSDICNQTKNAEQKSKVVKMKDYFAHYKGDSSVPDPYYGSPTDFEYTLDLIEDGCKGLLQSILKEDKKI